MSEVTEIEYLEEGSSAGCNHESTRYVDANSSECLECGEQIPNSYLIRGKL